MPKWDHRVYNMTGGIDLIGKAAVLKTAGRKPMGVRVPLPPFDSRIERPAQDNGGFGESM